MQDRAYALAIISIYFVFFGSLGASADPLFDPIVARGSKSLKIVVRHFWRVI